MKKINLNIIHEFYNLRSMIYGLLIFTNLLFLINLKQAGFDISFYLSILALIVFAVVSEFLFSLKRASKIYHAAHPLRNLYKRIRNRHLYNIIFLPIVQFTTCALIIFYSENILISLFFVVITSIFTYFTFIYYSKLYLNNLETSYETEEFFDASKYISFAFITYLLFILHAQYLIPRSFVSLIIGFVQLGYILSAIWRRDKLNINNVFLSLFSAMLITTFVYLYLVSIPLINQIGLIESSTAQVLLIDYVVTSLIIRRIEKRLTFTAAVEYLLVTLIGTMLLIFSR